MAIDSKAGHNSVADEPIGEIRIRLTENLGLQITASGAMHDPAFLEMARGYLRQYTDRVWDKTWQQAHQEEDEKE